MRVVLAMLKTGNTVCTPSANSLSHMAVKTTARSPQWDQHSKKCLHHNHIQEIFWKFDPRTVCTPSDKHACGQHSQALTLKHDAKHGWMHMMSKLCFLQVTRFVFHWGSPRSEANADSSLTRNARSQEKFTNPTADKSSKRL